LEKLDACPVCGYTVSETYLACTDYTVSGEIFTLEKCKNCNFVYTNPRPGEKQISRYYQSADYVSHNDTNKGLINKVYHVVRKKTLADKLRLINKIHARGKLLDIGCGTGAFLQVCKNDGWTVNGIEPDEGARAMAQIKLGATIERDILTSFSEEKFNVITLWHVLEHVHQLNETVEKIENLLSLGGKVVIAVPNINSYDAKHFGKYWAAYDIPKHLYHFSRETLELLMKKHGIKLVEVLPMKFDAYYIGLLSTRNKYKEIKFVEGLMEGFKSNNWAKKNKHSYSSLTYIFSR
jgi:2-polyprenyl-3-methyl-5-hydroxy-6-metoxy-1,4-benzoquinol methylase